jgi:FtsZ-binding cell division protein ZapB
MVGEEDCRFTRSEYELYHAPIAALLWCGVAYDNLNNELQKTSPSMPDGKAMAQAILRHPTLKCLEPRMRAIFIAIDNGLLPVCREDGTYVHGEHVAYSRRFIYGKDLKTWAKTLPIKEHPKFLMSNEELKPEISHEIYSRLKNEYDLLQAEHTRLKETTQYHSYQVSALERQITALNDRNSELEAQSSQQEKEEVGKGFNTSLAIIHALYEMANKPAIKSVSARTETVGRLVGEDAISNRLNNMTFKQ